MKRKIPVKGIIIITLGILLIIGAVSLGILQYGWINQVFKAEKEAILKNIRSSADQAFENTINEIRILYFLVSLSPGEVSNSDWSRISGSLSDWKQNTMFPDILLDLYLFKDETAANGLKYYPEEGFISRIEKDNSFINFLNSSQETPILEVIRRFSEEYLVTDSFSIPIPVRETSAFIVLNIDLQVLYKEVFPYYLSNSLENYPFRIVKDKVDTIFQSDFPLKENRPPEFTIPFIFRLFSTFRFASSGVENHTIQGVEVRKGLSRLVFSKAEQVIGEYNLNGINLEIYYPDNSLDSITSSRRMISLTFSVGILIILIGSIFALYRLYRKTEELRIQEQEFVASISHELRTPITVIRATSDNLLAGVIKDPKRITRYGGIIKLQAERLSGMVEGILLYSGILSGRNKKPQIIDFELDELLDEILIPIIESAHLARTEIKVVKRNIPGHINTDPSALRIILENLLMNAVRYSTPEGDIRLNLQVMITGKLRIIVEDDGPGIPQNEIKKIFFPFRRGDASIKAQIPGSGLGLHLVKRAAEMCGGQVLLESPYPETSGKMHSGCRFTVTIPLQEDADEK